MKYTKCLLMLTLAASLGLAGCNSTSSEDTTPSPSTSQIDYKSKLAAALEKDYSNMTAEVVSVYERGEGSEYYLEYYYNDYTIVYTPDVAEMGANPYTFFHDYNGKNYQYFEKDRPNDPTSTSAWLNTGKTEDIHYAIDYIYFNMEYFLAEVNAENAIYQSGMYVISNEAVVAHLNQTVFSTFFFNDIQYVVLTLNAEGYLSSIIGLQEIDNEDDYVKINIGAVGTTTAPATTIPEAPNAESVMEYWQYKGWDGPYVDKYVESISLTPKKSLEGDTLVLDIEEVVQAQYTYLPADANQAKDWRLHSTDESVATINFDFNGENGEQLVKITGVAAGDAEVYIVAPGVNGIDTGVQSNHIKVHVNALASQNTEGMVYDLSFTGFVENTLGVSNALNNNLPLSVTTAKASTNAGNNDLFGNNVTLLLDPNASGTGAASITFDFDDQQVSSISLYYGLYWSADKSNASWVNSIKIETSNDGEVWSAIDIKEEVLNNISANNLKLLEKEFEPASKVRLSLESGFTGKNYRFAFSNVKFMANEACHDHVDFVEVPVTSIAISTSETTLRSGKSLTVSYIVNPSDATNKTLTWHVSDETIATFENNVLTASATNTGSVEIYATSNNNVESNHITITVETLPTLPTGLIGTWIGDDNVTNVKLVFSANNVVATIKTSSVNETHTLTYEENDGNQYSFFEAGTTNKVVVSYSSFSGDTITPLVVIGSVEINKYSSNFDINRYIAATSINLTSSKTTLNIGESSTISISFNPTNATGFGSTDEITWTVDNDGIVKLTADTTSNKSGNTVTAQAAGTVTVTATNNDGVSGSITFTVNENVKVASISLSTADNKNTVEVNSTLTINANVTGIGGETPTNAQLKWSSSDTSVATVKDGVVTGKTASETPVTITATATDGSGVSATFEVTVIAPTSAIPAGLVGTWEGTDEGAYGSTIDIVIESDGNLTLNITGTEASYAYTLTSSSGTTYVFNDAEGNTLTVTFDARYPNEAKFELNGGEMTYNEYISLTGYGEFTKII